MEATSGETEATDAGLQDGGERKAPAALSVKILRNAIANYGGVFVTRLVGFLLTPFIVHRLGDTAYGIWALTGGIVAYLGLLDLGMSASVAKYVAEYRAKNQPQSVNEIVSTVFMLYCLLSLLVLFAILVLSLYFPAIFNVEGGYGQIGRVALFLVGIDFVIMLPTSILNAILVGYQRFDLNYLAGILALLVKSVLIVVLLNLGLGLVGLATTSIVSTLLLTAARFWATKRTAPKLRIHPKLFRRDIVPSVGKFSLVVFGLQVTGLVIYHTDNIVIGLFLPVAAITPFAIAYKLGILVRDAIAQPLGSVLMPAFSELDGMGRAEDRERIRRLLIQGTKATSVLVLPITAFLIVMGEHIIRLWVGKEYVGTSTPVLYALTVFFLSNALFRTGANLLFGLGRLRRYLYVCTGMALGNLLLSTLLVQFLGITGVAIGSAIPMAIGCGLFLFPHACEVVGLPIKRFFGESFVPAAIPIIPTVVITLLLSRYWPPVNLAVLALQFMICVSSYGLIYLMCISKEERTSYAARMRGLRRITHERT